MSEQGVSFASLMEEAKAAGVGFGELVPIGEYEMFIWKAKAGKTSNGKLRIEATGKIIGGPQDGKTVWNQFVLSRENAQAMGFFFRHMAILGAGVDWFTPRQLTEGTFAELAAHILGARFRCAVGVANVNKEDRNQFEKVMPSAVAPGQKMEGAAAPSPGGPAPSVPNIPTGIAAPAVPGAPSLVPQEVQAPVVPAPAAPAAPTAAAISVGTTADIGGVAMVYTGETWVPQGVAASPAPAAAGTEAPKAPF